MQTTQDTNNIQETLASAFAALPASGENSAVVTLKAYVLADEQEKAAKKAKAILKGEVEAIRATTVPKPKGTRVISYWKESDEGGSGVRQMVIAGAFRKKQGHYQITNVYNGGKHSVTVEAVLALVKDGTISKTVADILIGEKSDPYTYNLVSWEAGLVK